MMPNHHPDPPTLLAFSAGALAEAFALVAVGVSLWLPAARAVRNCQPPTTTTSARPTARATHNQGIEGWGVAVAAGG